MKYVYLVSYNFVLSGGIKSGFGNIDITTDGEVKNIRAVRKLEDEIKKILVKQYGMETIHVVILNMVKMDEYEELEESEEELV